jgi:hypothetical protein
MGFADPMTALDAIGETSELQGWSRGSISAEAR